jgi:hypothetical protein
MRIIPSIVPSLALPALLAVLATGCSSGSDESKKPAAKDAPVALAAIQSTPESEAKLHIATWEMYESKLHGYSVVARDRAGKVLHAIGVHVVSQSQGAPNPRVHLNFGHGATLVVDKELGVVQSSITREHLALGQSLSDALKASDARKDIQYSCLGDILWAVGGVIATIGTCASVVPGVVEGPLDGFNVAACVGTFTGGAVAGTVSAWQDCRSNDSNPYQGTSQVTVEVSYDYYWDPGQACWADYGSGWCDEAGY